MRYTDRKTRKRRKTEETRAMRYTDRKTQRKEKERHRKERKQKRHAP